MCVKCSKIKGLYSVEGRRNLVNTYRHPEDAHGGGSIMKRGFMPLVVIVFVVALFTMGTAAQGMKISIPSHSIGSEGTSVEIPVRIEGAENIQSIEFTVQFDDWVLDWKKPGEGSDFPGGTINDARVPGQKFDEEAKHEVKITWDSAVNGSGVFAVLKYYIWWCNPGEAIGIKILDVSINGQPATDVEIEDGSFEIGEEYRVSGNISYYVGDKPIPGATLHLVHIEGREFSGESTSEGIFEMGLTAGQYTVLAKKIGDIDGLSPYDASLILRAANNRLRLTSDQRIAADVDGNDQITSHDALALLKKIVGLRGSDVPADEDMWTFRPDTENVDVIGEQTTIQIVGMLKGDVSGSWGDETHVDPHVRFTVDDVAGKAGGSVAVPIRVDTGGRELYGVGLVLTYDPDKLEAENVVPVGAMDDSTMAFRIDKDAGKIHVALATDVPLRESGLLVEVEAYISNLLHPGTEIPLRLEAVFNHADAERVTHGRVVVEPHDSFTIGPDRISAATLVKDSDRVIWGDTYLSKSADSETGVYLAFPDLIESDSAMADVPRIPEDARIISAMLLWNFDSEALHKDDLPDKLMGFTIHRVTDPDQLGMPVLGGRSGTRTGLSYLMRDHRVGMDIPWTDGGETKTIRDALDPALANDLRTTYVRLNPVKVGSRRVVAEIRDFVQAWIDGEPNQGVYVQPYSGWEAGDRLPMEGLRLVVYYDDQPPTTVQPVTDDQVITSSGAVQLSWDYAGSTGVRVLRAEEMPVVGPYDPNGEMVIDGTESAFSDSDLVDGKEYYYALIAHDGDRNHSRVTLRRAVPGTLAPPAAVSVTADPTQAGAVMSWNAVTGAIGYAVYRRADDEWDFKKHWEQNEPTIATWTDRSVERDQTYHYYVVTVNEHGEGPQSAIERVTISADVQTVPPAAPSNLTAVAVSHQAIKLAWTDNSDNELRFEVRRADGSEWIDIGAVPANVTQLTVGGLQPSTEYQFRVRAWNEAGYSDESDPAWATTLPGPKSVSWTQITPGSIDVSWDYEDIGVAGVDIVVYETGVGEIKRLDHVPLFGPVRISQLIVDREYSVEIIFKSSDGTERAKARMDHIVTTNYLFKGPGL